MSSRSATPATATTPDPWAIIADQVADRVVAKLLELGAVGAKDEPAYRDRAAEAKRLGVSVSTLDRMCREGLPFVLVGDSRRFCAADVDTFLRARSSEAAQ